MLIEGLQGLEGAHHPLCIIGSGPAGLAVATDLARRGVRVLLLESGGNAANPAVQKLAMGDLQDPARHDDLMVATARRLGGTSNLWGGRSVPYDPVDFVDRPWVDARWPMAHEELMRWVGPAAAATCGGAAAYEAEEPLLPDSDPAFSADRLERWVNIQQAQVIHANAIAEEPLLEVRTHATVVDIEFAENGRVEAIKLAHSLSGARARLLVDTLVVAAGGLESARLLLAARRGAPDRFGGVDGPLGRYYMGHVIGEIADIVFADERTASAFDFAIDRHGSYTRRRIVAAAATQLEHRLLNCAFWPVVPPVADARHGSAILSLVYLALRIGPLGRRLTAEAIRRRHVPSRSGSVLPHVRNIATGLPGSVAFTIDFLRRRYDKQTRLPGFFVRNKARRYGWSYHAEQSPSAQSRVWLSNKSDWLGLPQLSIDFRFSELDTDSVVRNHDLLAGWLERSGIGRLEYRMPVEARGERVLAQAAHGTHQIGLVRMAANRREGVVNADLQTFDAPNLYVASSAVLPTSSQANPTVSTVALSLRLAERLAALSERPAPELRDAARVTQGGERTGRTGERGVAG